MSIAAPTSVAQAPASRAASAPALTPVAASDGDAQLGAVLDWVAARGLTLYPAQEEAIMALYDGAHVVLATPTGSGKSLVATALLYRALCRGEPGVYTCPVKALVNEKFFELCAVLGAAQVGLSTGDAQVNPGAPIQCVTAEVLANQCLRGRARARAVVMDEFHYYGDRERGMAWQVPLLTLTETQFLLMSATLGDLREIVAALRARTGREVIEVRGMQRPVPLSFEYRDTPLQETVADLARGGRAPVYLVHFTQREAAAEAQALTSLDLCTRAEKQALGEALRGERFPTPYGKEIQRLLRVGIGLHHGGLLPRYRRLCERLAQTGRLKVIAGTDTLGVGVNVPIRTVVFTQLCKFDGDKDGILPVREFHQIAGRAGRRGFDDQGFVVAQAPAHVIENQRLAAKGKKFVRKQPPQKGYVHWDKGTFERLVAGAPEPLVSRFAITHGVVMAALSAEGVDPRRGGGYRFVLELIAHSHESAGAKRRHKREAARAFRTLRRAGLVELRRDERARNPYPAPAGELQREFSLDHTLALYLVETLPRLPAGEPAAHAYDVLSLVEAILENPRPILLAQLDRERGRVVAELKAQGMEYEERMAELDKVEWPKPNRDFIYETFNAFAERHPWVGQDNIAPKGIARELVERNLTFNELVRELEVARSEGVLLRYLSSVHRTLVRGVPAQHRTSELEELTLFIESAVRVVDASLLQEWEALTGGPAGAGSEPGAAAAGAAPDGVGARPGGDAPGAAGADPLARLRGDARALRARVRAEVHRLLQALAQGDLDEALEAMAPADPEGQPWTAARLQAALDALRAEHGALDRGPAARESQLLRIEPVPGRPGVFQASHTLVTLGQPPEEADWALHLWIDLTAEARSDAPDDAPVIALARIGV